MLHGKIKIPLIAAAGKGLPLNKTIRIAGRERFGTFAPTVFYGYDIVLNALV